MNTSTPFGEEATTLDSESAPLSLKPTLPEGLTATSIIRKAPYGVSNVPLESLNAYGTSTSTNKIIRVAGQTVYIQNYEKAVTIFNVKLRTPKIRKPVPVRRDDSIKRSTRKIKDLALENYPLNPKSWGMPCFLTTTYADAQRGHPSNRNQQIADNNAFIRKLRARYGNGIKFLGVFEIQDGKRLQDKTKTPRNAVHTHWLVFDMPRNEWQDLKTMWGLGTVHINRMKFHYGDARTSAGRVSNYITKYAFYMTKYFPEVKNSGKKIYFVSKGLQQPNNFVRVEHINFFLDRLYHEGYECTNRTQPCYNPHFGEWCVYEEWNPPGT